MLEALGWDQENWLQFLPGPDRPLGKWLAVSQVPICGIGIMTPHREVEAKSRSCEEHREGFHVNGH